MQLRFIKCSSSEAKELVSLGRSTFIESFQKDNDPKDFDSYIEKAFSEEQINKELNNPNMSFYLVKKAGNTIGYFKLNQFRAQTDLQEEKGLEIERIYVKKPFQGKFIGHHMITYIKQKASLWSKEYIWLGVWEKNIPAIRFYEKNGFEKFGKHPYFIGNDKQMDWLMRFDLLILGQSKNKLNAKN